MWFLFLMSKELFLKKHLKWLESNKMSNDNFYFEYKDTTLTIFYKINLVSYILFWNEKN